MNIWKYNLLLICVLLAGIIFINQDMVKAGQEESPNYKKGRIRIDLGGEKIGTINWETKYITAKGTVAAPSNATNPSQGKALARRGAIVDAQRRLLEIIKGVSVDSKTIISDLMEVKEVLKSEVNGTVKNAEITDENWDGEMYELTMRVPMGKVISFVVKEKKKEYYTKPNFVRNSVYTGLVIDARGLNLEPAIFVNIYNKDGEKVCGPIHPVYRIGIKDIEDVNEERIGKNPLRITAKGIIGQNGVDIVISNGDAKKVRKKILNTGIFSKSKVIILLD